MKTARRINSTGSTYETFQGVLGWFSLPLGATWVGASIDFHLLKSEADLSAFGAEFYPALIGWSGFGFALVAGIQIWGYVVENKFWLKVELANRLHRFADKVDPRRRS